MSLRGVMTPVSVGVMTPDRYSVTLDRITEVIETLRELDVPPDVVHSIDVSFWAGDKAQVSIHVSGESETHRELVDRIGDHYELPADEGRDTNYYRGTHLGKTPVLVFCGRPEVQV